MRTFLYFVAIQMSFATITLFAPLAEAGCSCSCIDGRVQPICTNSFDIKPICPALTCPRSGVTAITPVGPPGSGARACREERVCDAFQRCEWKDPCR